MDTIVALASGRFPAAIAVLRMSGPAAFAAATALAGSLPPPRTLRLRTLRDAHGELLDRAMVVAFPAPASSTGEDVVELHLHGGPAVVAAVLAALTAHPDVRLAEPGEFTRRAFALGRMGLAEVEGLAELVAAETDSQRRQALALAGGALARAAEHWRSRCLDVLAEAEAALDFAEDEADVAERLNVGTGEALAAMAAELDAAIRDATRAARIRDGLTIVVTGRPNVGKSSLVNALAAQDAAIVSDRPGTTRDPISVPIDLDGIAAVLIDTAGLRETSDPVEAEGISRARARAAAADLVLHVSDTDGEADVQADAPAGAWQVRNKVDCAAEAGPLCDSRFAVSALHGHGLAALHRALTGWAAAALRPDEPPLLTNARHVAAFADAAAALREAAASGDMVLRAESLRCAAQALARISGRVGVDDVLDRIFATFCIGK